MKYILTYYHEDNIKNKYEVEYESLSRNNSQRNRMTAVWAMIDDLRSRNIDTKDFRRYRILETHREDRVSKKRVSTSNISFRVPFSNMNHELPIFVPAEINLIQTLFE